MQYFSWKAADQATWWKTVWQHLCKPNQSVHNMKQICDRVGGEICCVCFAMTPPGGRGRQRGRGGLRRGRRDFLRGAAHSSVSLHRPSSGNTGAGNWAASFHCECCKQRTFLNVQALHAYLSLPGGKCASETISDVWGFKIDCYIYSNTTLFMYHA